MAESATAEDELRMRLAAAAIPPGPNGPGIDPSQVEITGSATLDSAYPVSDLATATVATAGLTLADLRDALGHPPAVVRVDRGLVDTWFGVALSPVGWSIPSPWDALAGDYPCADDGWVRLHTNAPHHRAAALRVLAVDGDREHVAAAVERWSGDELEQAIVDEGGCAAVLRSADAWAGHAQGAAVAGEPLIASAPGDAWSGPSAWRPTPERPLAGLRVLDLTRVLSGPVATRLLAGLGAEVLRIDPPGWDEPAVVPDMTLGKRAARLDARDPADRAHLVELLADADVLVHGYRSDALERLGLGDDVRRATRPGLVDVSLDAYGHTGPWATRRGFDSLVQMSTGIAGAGLANRTADRPTPLPVQALDHGTGYLAAAAVLAGLAARVREGHGTRSRLSLARTALELERVRDRIKLPISVVGEVEAASTAAISIRAVEREPIDTPWGAATLPPAPLALDGVRVGWDRGPRPLGSDAPAW